MEATTHFRNVGDTKLPPHPKASPLGNMAQSWIKGSQRVPQGCATLNSQPISTQLSSARLGSTLVRATHTMLRPASHRAQYRGHHLAFYGSFWAPLCLPAITIPAYHHLQCSIMYYICASHMICYAPIWRFSADVASPRPPCFSSRSSQHVCVGISLSITHTSPRSLGLYQVCYVSLSAFLSCSAAPTFYAILQCYVFSLCRTMGNHWATTAHTGQPREMRGLVREDMVDVARDDAWRVRGNCVPHGKPGVCAGGATT